METKKKYPLIIVLDGDYLFDITSGSVDYLSYWGDIPENIVVDITDLDLNGSISAGDLTLDKDITLETLPDTTIVVCNEPKAESESTVDETADTDDDSSVQEESSPDANNKETDSNEDKKES